MKTISAMKFTFVAIIPMLFVSVVQSSSNNNPYGHFDKNEFDYIESDEKKWRELEWKVPEINLKKLVQLEIDHGPIAVNIYVDATSIKVNKNDRVVRYWLVFGKSKNKPSMLTFEGIRCATNEYKQFAYLSPSNTKAIQKIRQPDWRPIRQRHMRDYHNELAMDYFCEWNRPLDVKLIMQRLKGMKVFSNPYAEDN